MKTFFKRFIIFTIIIFLGLYIINSETDFFRSFKEVYPEFSEKYPAIAEGFESVGDVFSKIPTISQLGAHITNEEMPLSPDDFTENAYIKDSPLLTFYGDEAMGITVNDGKSITVFGVLQRLSRSYVAIQLIDEGNNVIYDTILPTDTEYKFSKTIDIPQTTDEILKVDIYTGAKKYGDYAGWANSYLFLEKENDSWSLKKSPVLENNRKLYSEKRPISVALKATDTVESENKSIKSVAEQLTAGCETDYEKLLALHDWICSYVHYDNDSLSKSSLADYKSTDVLKSRRAVCLGYANLYAALCRSIKIPCYVVTGYALGISSGDTTWSSSIVNGREENHAWNEAYVDGRWIIIDSTWDTFNSFENGQMTKGTEISHLYFDANIDFFSTNHKIVQYTKK